MGASWVDQRQVGEVSGEGDQAEVQDFEMVHAIGVFPSLQKKTAKEEVP
jgi:hypothetical protein